MDMETTNIPQQIQDELEQANALRAQLYEQQPEQPSEEVTAIESPEDKERQVVSADTETTSAKPARDFEQAYKTLRGKYDAEVPRLHQQIRELNNALRELQTRLEEAEKRHKQEEQSSVSSVTEKDIEFYGAEMVDFIRRVSTEVVNKATDKLMKQMNERIDQLVNNISNVQQTVTQSAMERFWSTVRSLVPDWDVVDNDPKWIEFLNSTPEFTTETYRDLAVKAIQAGDATKIANLVKIWRGNSASTETKSAASELKRQVSPSTTKAAVTPTTQKIWTGKDYAYIFSRKAEQELDPKTLAAKQAEAQLALAEGRIQW